MTFFDILFLILAGLILFSYVKRGFVSSLVEFVIVYIAFFVSSAFGNTVGGMIATWLPNLPTEICNSIGYVFTFVLSITLVRFAARVLTALLDRIKLIGTLNRVLGALLGLLMAFAFLMVIASVFKAFFSGNPLYEDSRVLKFLGEKVLPSVKVFDLAGV